MERFENSVLAACLGSCTEGSTGPIPPKQPQGCLRADSTKSPSSAWRSCGYWFSLPGADQGCHHN